MRKRVLLAEQSDAIRGVAETLLRQNGFEVIPITTAEKALEVLKFTRPDLMIIGSELVTLNQRPLYERIQNDPKAGTIAMLLFSESGGDLPFPPEVVIPRPFDPKEFLEKVMVFSGLLGSDTTEAVPNPLEKANLDDDLLDAALGIDHINVTDSEEMDRTAASAKSGQPKSSDKYIGLNHSEKDREETTDSSKVESLMIRDSEDTDIRRPAQQNKHIPPLSGTGKLEILTDQYLLADPNALDADREGQVHDYEWFIGEMRKEADGSPASAPPPSSTDNTPSPELSISEPASIVDPLTPPPAPPQSESTASQEKGGAVEKFLDDFKKEVEKIQSDDPQSVNLEPEQISSTVKPGQGGHIWEESTENITPEQLNLLTKQFCSELAEKIAEKIVTKIDSEKLFSLLRNEILSHFRNKP